jgi:hypothetical protein
MICDSNIEEAEELGIRGYRRAHKHEHEDGLEQMIQNRNFIEMYNLGIGDRVFYITEKGLIGLGPVDVAANDAVFAFCGGNCPFLLRQSAGNEGVKQWSYVGHTYTQGMMDGEGFNGVDELECIVIV